MMMNRKGLHWDGMSGVPAGGNSGASGGAEDAGDVPPENDTEQPVEGEEPVEAQGSEENQDGVADADGEQANETNPDPATTASTDYDQAMRDALMAALQQRFTQAQKDAQTSLKNGDAKGTEAAATEIMEVIEEAQAEVEKLEKQAANDPQAKQKQMQLAKRMVDMTFYLKTLRTQIADRTKKADVNAETKKAFKDLSSDINTFLRNKAEREQTKLSEFFRSAKDGLSQLTQMKQEANAKAKKGVETAEDAEESETSEPVTDEDKWAALELLPDDFTGVNGETGDLTSQEQKLVNKSVNQMKKAEEAKQFAEARAAQKTQSAETANSVDGAAQTASENNGEVPTPDKQQVKSTIHLLMKAGRLSKEVGRDLLKELAEKGVARFTTGAEIYASKTDEEAYEACFSGLQEQAAGVLGLSGQADGEDQADGVEGRASRSGFRNSVCSLMTALKGGILRQKAVQIAASREVTSQTTYSGESVEAGQLAYSQMVGDGTRVAGDEDHRADHYQYQAQIDSELKEKGQVKNSILITLDPSIPVGPVA